jgi:hypothetical protein
VEALDDSGRPVPTASLPVEFEISGPGAIIGLGNGDPTSHELDKGAKRSLFNGLAQVIVQGQRGTSGSLVLRAQSVGIKSAETTILVDACIRCRRFQSRSSSDRSLCRFRYTSIFKRGTDPPSPRARSCAEFRH